MNKYASLLLLVPFLFPFSSTCQDKTDIASLPVNVVTSAVNDNGKPFILYLTGDGGWNSFSQGLSKDLASKGYPVVALNANKYFWKKKTPAQAAADCALLINEYGRQWNRIKVSIIGYSFGADVMPFIYNRLPSDVSAKVKSITLLSPSTATDFEIHVMGMLGGKSSGSSVPAEINKMGNVPLLILCGDNEKDFPFEQLTSKKYSRKLLAGGHHYDGDVGQVSSAIVQGGL